MRQPASTDREVMLRELNETEAALADISRVLGCTCIIDPTETLADRVRHLGTMVIITQIGIGQLQKYANARRADENLDNLSPSKLLDRLGEN